MMEPGAHLATTSDRPAVIMADSGVMVTYAQLDERSKRLAQLFFAAGLRPGDHLAVLLENHPRYFEVYWAALRAGLYLTPINWHLRAEEVEYIIGDCGASALVTSVAMAGIVAGLGDSIAGVSTRLVMDGEIDGFDRYEDAIARFVAEPLADEIEGATMFYSSGTTGRPKGIKPPISGAKFGTTMPPIMGLVQNLFGFTSDTIYLSPAPLYHAAPLGWTTAVHRIGGTCVVMERFDAKRTLELIDEHDVTHAQFVPTHFVRMLKLPEAERNAHDLSSLQVAVHAAAPCPVEVKAQMIEWWGTKIYEFYAGSEGNGFCFIGPEDWLTHRGTVGKAMLGIVHILDEDGNELPVGEPGQIWFESAVRFEYHNDPAKTADAFNTQGWSSLGDVGYLDAEGYLYLTDRISHMIISGGVNIYPQEVENLLTMHPAVADVAVIGVPHAEMGEAVKAVVIASDSAAAGPELEAQLIAYCKEHMATYKCPATVDFVDALPRLPTGKLLKRELRSRYWP